jgi:hypothetical protein
MQEQHSTERVHCADETNSGEPSMSTYDRNPNPRGTGNSTGWIVGAIVVVLIIIGLFYWGGSNTNTATNTATPPAATTTGSGVGSTTPRPATPAKPAAPAPSTPSATPPANNSK